MGIPPVPVCDAKDVFRFQGAEVKTPEEFFARLERARLPLVEVNGAAVAPAR